MDPLLKGISGTMQSLQVRVAYINSSGAITTSSGLGKLPGPTTNKIGVCQTRRHIAVPRPAEIFAG
jgi:hypothetical protein